MNKGQVKEILKKIETLKVKVHQISNNNKSELYKKMLLKVSHTCVEL